MCGGVEVDVHIFFASAIVADGDYFLDSNLSGLISRHECGGEDTNVHPCP
jgi:hypothetical protein